MDLRTPLGRRARTGQIEPRLAGLLLSCSLVATAVLYPASSADGQTKKAAPRKVAPKPTFEKDVRPVVTKFCAPCHGAKDPMAGLSLTKYKDAASVSAASAVWEKVARNVNSGHMPPPGAPAPTKAQRKALLEWIETTLSGECRLTDPGRVTLRRLNRQEYTNTVRDLLGVETTVAEEFPSDDVGYGFDNIGDVLSVSPLHVEKYLAAAEKISERTIYVPEVAPRYETDEMPAARGTNIADSGERVFFTNGVVATPHEFKKDGQYRLRAYAYASQAGPEPAKMAFLLDGKIVGTVEVKAGIASPALYEVPTFVSAGKHQVGVAFTNDFYDPTLAPGKQDRNLVVDYVEIVGPLGPARPLPASHRRLLGSLPTNLNRADKSRLFAQKLGSRAYRRPVTKEETDAILRVMALAEKHGEPFERSAQLAVQAVLVSPHFLFRVELDGTAGKARALNGYELASRLSYFLWSSMPDEELFALAAKGALARPQVLAAQARRMLKDPKARALGTNFAAQWLQLRKLATASPDPAFGFNEELREAMLTETTMFFDTVVREDRSVLDFLDGRFTFVNGALAQHYGIPGVTGPAFKRVALKGGTRGGVLTHASVLTVTSNPTRTSPVKRGKWVLEQFLGTPPPPPPPGVPDLKDDGKRLDAATLRKRMEQHRKDPACATCHQRMDPLGFGLENFDAVGRWRTKEGTASIDSSGKLPGGKTFKGPEALRAILMEQKGQFVRSLSEKMLTFALGRGVEFPDKCHVDEIVKKATVGEYRFSALVEAIVQSEPFRKRKGGGK